MTLRRERPADAAAIRVVHERAFERSGEAALVDALRDADARVVSLVAEADGVIVAHVLFTPVTIGDVAHQGLGMGPVAVLPAHQRQGVGALLVRRGLAECARLGHGVVVVLGEPAYYHRFGFTRASAYGLRCEYDAPDEAFLALELRQGALGALRGLVRYRPEFGRV